MAKRLVTVGDLVLDLLLDVSLPVKADAHQMSPQLLLEPGGACTTLLAARHFGLEAVALGAVGDDAQGRMLLEMLEAAGVVTDALDRPAESGTTTVVALGDRRRGGHVFLGHYGDGPPVHMTPEAKAEFRAADAVYIAGYSLVEERLRPLVEGVLSGLRGAAAPLYVDVGPFLGQLAQPEVDGILEATDVLLLTEEEIPFVAAGQAGVAACRRLLDDNSDLLIVLKKGADGCQILAANLDLDCPGFPVAVVDSIGAGDAFAAAFIWAKLSGYSLEDCGTIGNAMGAASVTVPGAGRNAPRRQDAQQVLDQFSTGIKLKC